MRVCTQESFNTGADFVSGMALGNGFIAVSMTSYGPCLFRIYILAMKRKNLDIQISISKTSSILPEILEKSKSTVLVSLSGYNRIPQTSGLNNKCLYLTVLEAEVQA